MNETILDSHQIEYTLRKKSVGVAYVWLLFLGGFGANNFYYDQEWLGIMKIIIFIICLTGEASLFVETLLPVVTIVIVSVELFMIPSIVEKCNAGILLKIKTGQML